MITAFEVGAVFRVINRASPTLTAMLRQVRALNDAIEKAKIALADLNAGTSLPSAGLTAAIDETRTLAAEWRNVTKAAGQARLAIGSASATAARGGAMAATGGAVVGGGSGRGGRHQPGWLRTHVMGPGIETPGGGHIRLGGAGAVGLGLLGYGAYEAAEMQDAVFQLIYHSGLEQNDKNRAKFKKVLQDAMSQSGYGLHDISEAAKQEIRMFQGTPGGGLDVLPEMLRAATTEARLKGSSPEEAMTALVGLAHMTKQYDPQAIKKLAPAFAFLSTANPSQLTSIERAAGYAVPLLQSGLEIDPMQTLLLGTALTRAGATNTKSGTWLRSLMTRAMPGTSLMSRKAFEKHEEALKRLGLVDDQNKPTWFTDNKPDPFKLLDIASSNAAKIPLTERAGLEQQLFGAQGVGAFALLADPAVRQQVDALNKEMNSTEFKNRYGGFVQSYQEGSTLQRGRTALADFNNAMMDIGDKVLPAVNGTLKDFQSAIQGVIRLIPGTGTSNGAATIGKRTLEGAAGGAIIGGGIGAFGGPVGAVAGGIAGGVAGGVYGIAEQYMKTMERPIDRFGRQVVITGNSAAQAAEGMKALGDAIKSLPQGGGSVFPGGAQGPAHKISLQLNLDGRTLAEAMSHQLSDLGLYSSGGPTSNDSGRWQGGDDYSSDI